MGDSDACIFLKIRQSPLSSSVLLLKQRQIGTIYIKRALGTFPSKIWDDWAFFGQKATFVTNIVAKIIPLFRRLCLRRELKKPFFLPESIPCSIKRHSVRSFGRGVLVWYGKWKERIEKEDILAGKWRSGATGRQCWCATAEQVTWQSLSAGIHFAFESWLPSWIVIRGKRSSFCWVYAAFEEFCLDLRWVCYS